MFSSKLIGDVKERRNREKTNICLCLFVAIVSAATKQTYIIYCVAGHIDVSSVTPYVFSSLSHQLRPFVFYTVATMIMRCMHIVAPFFFRFSRRCRRRRLTTHTHITYTFHSHPLHLSLSLFFSLLLFKRRNSVQNCLSFFAVDVHIRSSPSSPLTHIFTL
jgi:hypothetical protein